MLSQSALASLRGSGVISNAKEKASQALNMLAAADAGARLASGRVAKIQERADKAATLADMKAKKAEAARALKAKQEADALLALKKRKDEAAGTVAHLSKKLDLVKQSAEKADKAKVQAQLAKEKTQKNKAMLHALSAEGKQEASAKKAALAMKEAGAKAAKGNQTPCDTCMAKCSSDVCRTWCNAQWCDGSRGAAHKKEIRNKLRIAKKQQSSAAFEVEKSKESLAADQKKKDAASKEANQEMSKADESEKPKDVKEARDDTDAVAEDNKNVRYDKQMVHKSEQLENAAKQQLEKLESSIYYKP